MIQPTASGMVTIRDRIFKRTTMKMSVYLHKSNTLLVQLHGGKVYTFRGVAPSDPIIEQARHAGSHNG